MNPRGVWCQSKLSSHLTPLPHSRVTADTSAPETHETAEHPRNTFHANCSGFGASNAALELNRNLWLPARRPAPAGLVLPALMRPGGSATHGSGSALGRVGRGKNVWGATRMWRKRSSASGEGPHREGRVRLCPHHLCDLGQGTKLSEPHPQMELVILYLGGCPGNSSRQLRPRSHTQHGGSSFFSPPAPFVWFSRG